MIQNDGTRSGQLLKRKLELSAELAEINTELSKLNPTGGIHQAIFASAENSILDLRNYYSFSFDLREDHYTFISDSIKQVIGYHPGEFLRKSTADYFALVHPDDTQPILQQLEVYLNPSKSCAQKFFSTENRMMHKKGHYVLVHNWGVVTYDSQGKAEFLHGVTHNVSAYNEINRSLYLIKNFVDRASDPAFLHSSTGQVIYVNKAACTALQLDRTTLCKMKIWDLNREISGEIWSMLWSSLKDKGAHSFETEYTTSKGIVIPMEASANYVQQDGVEYCFVFAKDISERKRHRKELFASHEKYRLLVENQKEIILKLDPQKHCIFVSPSYCETFGVDEYNVLGKPLNFEIHPEDDQEFLSLEFSKVFAGDFEASFQQRLKTKAGWQWFEWSNRAVLNQLGEVKEIICVGRNVTDRKIAEEALMLSQKRYNLAVSAGHVSVWDHDIKSGLVYVDQGISSSKKGKSLQIRSREKWIKFVHPEDREVLKILYKQMLAGKKENVETEIRAYSENQKLNWQLVRASIVRDSKGNPVRIVGTSSNIDKLKHAEIELSKRLAYEKSLAIASRNLMTDYSPTTLDSVLNQFCSSSGARSVAVFRNSDSNSGVSFKLTNCSRINDDKMPGLTANSQFHYIKGYFNWLEQLSKSRRVLIESETASDAEKTLLEKFGSTCALLFPISVAGQWWGFIAFWHVKNQDIKSENHQTMLQLSAEILSAYLDRKQAQDALKNAHAVLEQRVEERTCDLLEANEQLRLEAVQRQKITDALSHSEDELEIANQKLLENSEIERRILASELHDSVAQDLVVLQLLVQNNIRSMDHVPGWLRQCSEICTKSIGDIRRICQGLYPPELETMGLNNGLRGLADFYGITGLKVEFDWQLGDNTPRFDSSLEIALFRIAQEAISNSMKHGKAEQIIITVKYDKQNMVLQIADDGIGLPVGSTPKSGHGMQTMKNRAHAVGGQFSINSTANPRRTIVRVEIPRAQIKKRKIVSSIEDRKE